ncbi:hypothetical protein [Streptomyces sp. NPDC056069]|uniref:hypothetical protein n=1 Tax=Streptomyces sp. NPDC056069 TaxID=3345702 RepID=UPI0035E01DDE
MGSPSRATWAKYMNGSAIIPRRTLGALVKAVSGTDSHRLSALLREASLLWKAADDESRRPEEDGGESALVRLHERLAEAMEGRHRADLAAAKANATVGTLRDMGALMGVVIDSTKAQLRMATDRERVGLKQQLGEAERRSERIAQELVRARNRRYTAEQARQALAKEMIAAREEIARLQHSIARIAVPDLPAMAPVALLPAPAVVMEVLDERLAVIVSEGHEADDEVADLAELANLEPGTWCLRHAAQHRGRGRRTPGSGARTASGQPQEEGCPAPGRNGLGTRETGARQAARHSPAARFKPRRGVPCSGSSAGRFACR